MSRSGSANGGASQLLGELFHEEIDWAALLRAVHGSARSAADRVRVPDETLGGDDGPAAAFLAALIERIEEAGQAFLADSSSPESFGDEADAPAQVDQSAAADEQEGAAEGPAPDDSTQPADALPFTDPELAAMFADLQTQLPDVRAMIDAAVARVFPGFAGHSGIVPGIFAGDAPGDSPALPQGLPLPHIFPPALPIDLGG